MCFMAHVVLPHAGRPTIIITYRHERENEKGTYKQVSKQVRYKVT